MNWDSHKFLIIFSNDEIYLGNQQIRVVEMTSIKFRAVARRGANFDTNFLTFTGRFNGFVIHFNVGHDPNADKLRK